MADVVELPISTGVGPYHFNRYRAVFEKPCDLTEEELARDFIAGFPHYFNSR